MKNNGGDPRFGAISAVFIRFEVYLTCRYVNSLLFIQVATRVGCVLAVTGVVDNALDRQLAHSRGMRLRENKSKPRGKYPSTRTLAWDASPLPLLGLGDEDPSTRTLAWDASYLKIANKYYEFRQLAHSRGMRRRNIQFLSRIFS